MSSTIVKILREKKVPTKDESSGKKVVITKSKEFEKDLAKYGPQIGDKLKEFLKMKSDDPMSRFGAKDQHFTGGGPLGTAGVIHAHLNHDVQVLYRRSGKNPAKIELLRLGTHDDFGTGQPPNMKAQKTLAKQVVSLVTEAHKGDVLQDKFTVLRDKFKSSKSEDGEKMSRAETMQLRRVKRIKDHDVWAGGNRPSFGPALSTKVSATREVVLQRRLSDGKITVAQRSDSLSPENDTTLRSFPNTEQGYDKALSYYISLT